MEVKKLNPAQIACKVVGGQKALAQALCDRGVNVTPQAVQQWTTGKGLIPPGKVRWVSEITNLPWHVLNPEVFPKE